MPSNPEDVILVKLPRTLHARLRQLGERWQLAYARGQKAPGNPDGKSLSLQAIITVLLDREESHQARSRRPRKPRPVHYQG